MGGTMADSVKILFEEATGEIQEKKSRFIATIRPVKTLDEANAFIDEIKKKYWDARHNCSALVIGEKNEISRCSDDGEPSGTAGRPMLEVIMGAGIHNVCVVVTRYFGGVLLGTGGLVRAYQGAVKEALSQAHIIEKTMGRHLEICCDYNGIGKIQYIMGQKGIIPLDTIYAEKVTIKLALELGSIDEFLKEITEALNGNLEYEAGQEICFTVLDGKTIIMT